MKTIKTKTAVMFISFAACSLSLPSCSTINNMNRTQKGAIIGSAAGGTLGAIIGKKAGSTALGAIIGGAVGGTAGAFIGRRMDRQAEELKQTLPDAEVIREGEGIIVKFDSGILFDTGKSDLKAPAKANIEKLAASLKNNPETNILIVGHTDDTGSDTYNLGLSEQRAQAVKNYAIAQGISSARMTTQGKGESEPIADNTTEAGRAQNRRVEIAIVANDQLKQEAKAQ